MSRKETLKILKNERKKLASFTYELNPRPPLVLPYICSAAGQSICPPIVLETHGAPIIH